MRYSLFLLIVLLSLAACAESAKYDIDLTCDTNFYNWNPYSTIEEDGTVAHVCGKKTPDDKDMKSTFIIKCEHATMQEIGQEIGKTYLCTTRDKKSVRIRVAQ